MQDLDLVRERLGGRQFDGYISTYCPFHSDNNPSLLVFPDTYKCLACGAWGKTSSLVSTPYAHKPRKVKMPVRPRDVSKFATRAYEFLHNNDQFQAYAYSRGIGDMIYKCQIGFWEGFYTFPIYDHMRNTRNIVYRAGSYAESIGSPKYVCRGEQGVYCPDWMWTLDPGHTVLFVVFGIIDAIVLAMLKFPVVTSTNGMRGVKASWFDTWRTRIVVVPDEGEGQVAEDLANQLGWRGDVLYLDYDNETQDPADYAKAGRLEELEVALNEATG